MNKTLSTLLGVSVLATGLIAVSPKQAQAGISFYLGNNVTSPPFFEQALSYSYSQSGVSLTATGISGTSTTRDVTRQLLGLGVYSPILGVDNPELDGLGFNETLRLTFDQTVALNSITFALVDTGDEFTLLVDGNRLYTDQALNAGIGFEFLSDFVFNPAPNGRQFGITTTDTLDQYFVKYVNVTPVPEPITLLGSTIALGFGTYLKRKMNKQKTKA